MSIDPFLVQLQSELADLDQELQAVENRRDLSAGDRVRDKAFLQHRRQKKSLEIEISEQTEVVRQCEHDVEEKQKLCEWAKSPEGRKTVRKKEIRREAGGFDGATHKALTHLDRLEPEARAISRIEGNLASAQNGLSRAQARLSKKRTDLRELEAKDTKWAALVGVGRRRIDRLPSEATPSRSSAPAQQRPDFIADTLLRKVGEELNRILALPDPASHAKDIIGLHRGKNYERLAQPFRDAGASYAEQKRSEGWIAQKTTDLVSLLCSNFSRGWKTHAGDPEQLTALLARPQQEAVWAAREWAGIRATGQQLRVSSGLLPTPLKPIRGGSLRRHGPKPMQTLQGWPPYYPDDLKVTTTVIVGAAVQKFPQPQLLELCKHVVSELTQPFCAAVESKRLRDDLALYHVRGLLKHLLTDNCDHSSERHRLEEEIMRSEEWQNFAKEIMKAAAATGEGGSGKAPEAEAQATRAVGHQEQGAAAHHPESKSWSDIQIWFLSEHRVQISVGGSIETQNYAEWGFEDRRNGKPRAAWKTLSELASGNGVLRTAEDGKWARIEKRVEEIRKLFRSRFSIEQDPIPFVKGTGYQARFKIGLKQSYAT
jgi:hypothetical protein